MHLVLLLLIQVHAEWVEIYQQHYQKPLRPIYTALEQPGIDRTTKGNRIYINNSLPEYNWNKVVHNVPNNNIRKNHYETSIASVISKHEIPEEKPMRIINVEYIETKKKDIMNLPKPVKVQSVKTADFVNHEDPKISNAVVVQLLNSTEGTGKPIKYDDDFEIKPLEVYNLSDLELITEEYTATVINNINVHAPLTTSAATIFETPSEHSLITKIPKKDLIKVTEQDFFEDDWPINDDRYEYVVQIVPSNSNKRRVDIVRNTVNPNVVKGTNVNIFESHKPTSTWAPKSNHNLKVDTEISSFEKILFVRDTTVSPKLQSSSKPQNIKDKATTKASPIQPEPEIETFIFDGNKTKMIHLSTKNNPKTKLKVDNNYIQNNSSIPTTDPDKVMIHEILKDQVMSSEITSPELSQSHLGIIKKVYPTKIIKVDKTGHEIDGAVNPLPPTKATFTNDKFTIIQHNKENQDKNIYKIPYQANIKQASVITQKSLNKTKEIKEENIRPATTQTTQDLNAVIGSINDDQIYKTPVKENFKPIPKVTTKKTPTLTTTETKYNIFDRDTGTTDPDSYERYITLQHKIPEFITKEEDFNSEQEFDNSKVNDSGDVNSDAQKYDVHTNVNEMDTEIVETNIKKVSDEMVTENPSKVKNGDKHDNIDAEDRDHESLSSENKPSTMETLMKVLKIVTDTIKRNTRRNVNSKVRYLEDLRDTISRSISK